jgi:hypothetical protein
MNTESETARYLRLADDANAIGDNAARLWGQLEATERAASAAWAAAHHAAHDAGDNGSATYAETMSRRHWKSAERLRVAFHRSTGRDLAS